MTLAPTVLDTLDDRSATMNGHAGVGVGHENPRGGRGPVTRHVPPGGAGGQRGEAPVTSGRAGSPAHALIEPSYTATSSRPARARACASPVAAIPPPQ